ncbi:MAG: hypothetical protein ACREP8_14155 [Candidatus Binatia bacterium]
MEFLGGMYAFPGGSVTEDDCAEAVLRRCYGPSRTEAQKILGDNARPDLSLGHWVAATRELFEEVGVLLCVGEDGKALNMSAQALKRRLTEKRLALLEGSMDFPTLLESEKLYCNAPSLKCLSHWLTPEEFPIRFDTRFYVSLLPPGQAPLPNSQEVAESLWITPDRALKLCRQGDLPVIFSTFATVRALADFDSWPKLLAEFGLL